ncbi:conserved Plasmodium protein, unknown function [Plasmodium gallinaceum]|uniref:Uncharacterized protein n=1 Tax=Plasmodium gallinaceum TaxID=5849 RepID=A0A1J1GNV5_PLAGA|nr:conserved Plasmodium protein, unknown function [Plasmodium gallinaceum]CRG94085.1 conserved Plasmodium protein, unknown function [Plasmodium gallinaceum]
MLGKFISDTYNKVKSKADEVRLHVSAQAIKAKEVFGLIKPTTIEELEVLLNYELQQIDTAEALINIYKKWIYNICQSEKSDCIRYYKSENKNNEKNLSSHVKHNIIDNVIEIKNENNEKNTIQLKNEGELKYSDKNKLKKDINTYINENSTMTFNSSNDNNDNLQFQKKPNNNEDEFSISKEKENLLEEKKNPLKKSNNNFKINNNSILEKNKDNLMNNIYDDHYGYNYKEIFLKSNILEKSVSLILEKRNIRLSLVGPIEKEDLENPRTTILTMFKHCLIGNEKLHKDILFIILTTDKLFDNHKELFLELLSILKYDYLDIYLTNLRKIISSEVVCLKNRIQTYDSQSINLNKFNFINNYTPNSSNSYIDLENDIYDANSLHHEKVDDKEYEEEKKQNNEENIFNQEEKCEMNKEKEFRLYKEDKIEINEEKIYEPFDGDENRKSCIENSKEESILDSLSSEKEIIESNKMQQIKILASSKLIELHKTVQKILLLATKNREERKVEIKVKLEELKKIMDVCKKDCEITLSDAEGSKTHLENIYVKELDLLKSNINKKQEEVNKMKISIDKLIKRKNELYNEYELVCKEINLKNKELSKVISTLSLYKKDLNETEDNYLNKLSSTSKEKHMHQERKLYILNLHNISNEILSIYEKSNYINTDELITKSSKIQKPLKQVIIQHLNYLKDKLFLLNALLKFYVEKIKLFLEKKILVNNLPKINTDMKEEEIINDSNSKNNHSININSENLTNDIYDKENKLQFLKYKKCYFKVIEQISKVWVIIQEFYIQNKKQIEDSDETKCSGKYIYNEINEIYNSSKKFIMENNQIISSVA